MSKFSEKKPQNVIFSSMKSDINERDYYMIKINNKFKKLNELLIYFQLIFQIICLKIFYIKFQ